MKRPSFQFYPADWAGNANLRRCTHEEKGIWMDVMCILHDQEEYGIAKWTAKELAQAVGCSPQKLKSLINKGILKGADSGQETEGLIYVPRSGRKNGAPVTLIEPQKGPIWFSSRMVIDEYKRVIRGGESEAPKAPPKDSPKHTPNPSPKGGIGERIDDTPKGTPDPSPSRARPSSSSTSSTTCITHPNGCDGKPSDPGPPALTTKEEIWHAGKSLLLASGMPEKQCGTYVGKLCKDYGNDVVVEAVRTAVVERPADPASFLKALCQSKAGERTPAQKGRVAALHNDFSKQDYFEGVNADGSF